MSQSLSNLLIHMVFSTKERCPFIQPTIESRLYQYISTVCADLGSPTIYIGGMPDHIHILLSLSRTITMSDLVSKIKSHSSRWMKTIDVQHNTFAWQNGYGAFSIGESGRQQTVEYIANQKEHHRNLSFKEEFLLFLNKYQISFNEKYLWD